MAVASAPALPGGGEPHNGALKPALLEPQHEFPQYGYEKKTKLDRKWRAQADGQWLRVEPLRDHDGHGGHGVGGHDDRGRDRHDGGTHGFHIVGDFGGEFVHDTHVHGNAHPEAHAGNAADDLGDHLYRAHQLFERV